MIDKKPLNYTAS